MTGSPDRDPACYDLTLTGVEQKKQSQQKVCVVYLPAKPTRNST